MTEFCPRCFRMLELDTRECPTCGTDTSAWESDRDLDARLEAALKHPVDDVRMRAVYALGKRGIECACPALVSCALAWPNDVVQGLEIVKALNAMPDGDARGDALASLAKTHSAHAVREAAKTALG